jgi:hypothetical protein
VNETLVCSTSRIFPDDHESRCAVCFVAVFYRPHSAIVSRRLCMKCGMREMAAEGQVPVMTDATRRELIANGINPDEAAALMLRRMWEVGTREGSGKKPGKAG